MTCQETVGVAGNWRKSVTARWILLLGFALAGCLNHQRVIVEVPETQQVLANSNEAPAVLTHSSGDSPDELIDIASGADHREILRVSSPARPWHYIVLHHSGSNVGNVRNIDEEHRQRTDSSGQNWLGIGYHFVIGNGRDMEDGEIQPTFRWQQQIAGAHAGKRDYNQVGIGICLIGDFNREPPTPRQLAACQQLVSQLCEEHHLELSDVIRHSDVKSTECPGKYFPFEKIAQHPTEVQRH